MPFLYTIIPSEIISGEYQKGTFRIYLTRPPSRSLILTSKLMYVVFSTVIIHIFFFLYTISISLIILNSGDLAVYHKGLLFLLANSINGCIIFLAELPNAIPSGKLFIFKNSKVFLLVPPAS